MRLLNIQWRNIFSYGNKIENINFDDHGKIWQLSGVSGAGKSSFLVIPKLLFYGKHEGQNGKNLKVNDIANWTNKNGWIKGTVKKGEDIYTIVRTFAPSGLELYKNGESLDKAGLSNMQEIIETEILDNLPYQIFSNVMTLSLNNFKSFISMSPADKRLIIDRIFSLEVLNKVHEFVKKDMKDLGNAINVSNSQIYSLNQTIQTSKAELTNLINTQTEITAIDSEKIKERISKVEDVYKQQSSANETYQQKYNDIQATENTILQECTKYNMALTEINRQIALFNESKCPTCGTPFTGESFDELRLSLNKKRQDCENMISAYNDNINAIRTSKAELVSGLTTLKSNIMQIVQKRAELYADLKKLEEHTNEGSQYKAIENIINETEKTKKDVESSVSESNNKMFLLNILENIYSAEGIKRQMMDNYIPILNDEIRETLDRFGFPYELEFDNNFDPILKYLGKEISPANVSTGENKKLDIAVLCSVLRMVKRKYPQINLMCLDETVSSLDYESSSDIIKCLKELAVNMDMNLFIVSHTQLDENLFDERLFIEKINGFTQIKSENGK